MTNNSGALEQLSTQITVEEAYPSFLEENKNQFWAEISRDISEGRMVDVKHFSEAVKLLRNQAYSITTQACREQTLGKLPDTVKEALLAELTGDPRNICYFQATKLESEIAKINAELEPKGIFSKVKDEESKRKRRDELSEQAVRWKHYAQKNYPIYR